MIYFLLKLKIQYIFQSELDYDGWMQVRLWHSFDDGPVPHYVERGNVTVSSIRSGAAIIVQPTNSPANIDKLVNLAEHGSKYRLKAVIATSSGSETTFLSSVPAVIIFYVTLVSLLNYNNTIFTRLSSLYDFSVIY